MFHATNFKMSKKTTIRFHIGPIILLTKFSLNNLVKNIILSQFS
jgi:hypothetical protein